jgi:Cache domain
MPHDNLEIRVSLQKLLLGLVVVIVPLSLVGLYITSESVSSVEEAHGAHLKAIAQATAGTVSQFIDRLVTEVGSIALAPALRDAVSSADRSYQNTSDAAIRDRMDTLEGKWTTHGVDSMVKEILTSPAAGYLRAYRDVDPRLLRIWVTDEAGAIVAATDKPQHYYQGKQDYWQAVYAQGRGSNSVSNILYDERNKSNYISIGMPIFDQTSGQVLGVVNAWVDVSGLSSPFAKNSLDGTAQVFLVGEDGTVIVGPNVEPANKLKSEEYGAVRDGLATVKGRQAGHVMATTSGGKRLAGFADTGLRQAYPNLDWTVVVSEDERDATAPIRPVVRFAFSMVALSVVMLTLLAVYFFLHRRQQIPEIETLHPEPPPPRKMPASA